MRFLILTLCAAAAVALPQDAKPAKKFFPGAGVGDFGAGVGDFGAGGAGAFPGGTGSFPVGVGAFPGGVGAFPGGAGAFPGGAGAFPGGVGTSGFLPGGGGFGTGGLTGSVPGAVGPDGKQPKFCRAPIGSQYVPCKEGSCPPVRAVCPTRNFVPTCYNDFDCPLEQKCCFDVCAGTVCKPNVNVDPSENIFG